MDALQLTQKLQNDIPLCHFMQLRVSELTSTKIEVTAPLQPNLNMHGTAFAGSIYALAAATGWGLWEQFLRDADCQAELVLKRAEMFYRRPIQTGLRLTASINDQQAAYIKAQILEAKEAGIRKSSSIQLPIEVSIYSNAPKRCASFEAEYIAVMPAGVSQSVHCET